MGRQEKRWNIVVVVADTLRTAYIGAYGNDWIKTPNFSRLAERRKRGRSLGDKGKIAWM